MHLQRKIICLQLVVGLILNYSCSFMQTNKQPGNGNDQLLTENIFQAKPVQLTQSASGHCLNSTQCFSPDDQWIVYDTRNHDSLISRTGTVEMVNTVTGETRVIYQTQNQTEYGPGVGGVTFHPHRHEVLFIHGLRNANASRPYSFSRRTGVMVATDKPGIGNFMDARDVDPPFTPGALRGGTHAHTWSGDGEWISFTYNDDVMAQLAATNPEVKDLRTIGIMVPAGPVKVSGDTSGENNNGRMFSVLVAEVKENPRPQTDDISKAFDECWIGTHGYINTNGQRISKAIAFQGHVTDEAGAIKTDIFVVDLPADLTKERPGFPLEGTATTRPNVPAGVTRRRITHLAKGVSPVPRHWLRAVPDGSLIGFLQEDSAGRIQLFGVSPNGGEVRQLTYQPFSIQGPFNFSPDGKYAAYAADNSVFITELESGKYARVTEKATDDERPVGAVKWSNKGDMLAWNAYKGSGDNRFLQVFILKKKQGNAE